MDNHSMQHSPSMIDDMAKGFGRFVDEVLRGRSNKTILNTSVGMAALEVGVPQDVESYLDLDIPTMVVNNSDIYSSTLLRDHPLFHFEAPTIDDSSGFTLFGLDFNDLWNQLAHGADSSHHTPFYEQNVATSIGLPDLPYGGLAHFAHMGMALYDSGRTFQDLWGELAEKYAEENTNPLEQAAKYAARTGKIITHPDMLHTLAARGTMLTAMGLLHPLGPLIAIGVSYLCMHLVHSFFGLMERNKDAVRHIKSVPVLREIYNASGIKEWADRDKDELTPEEEAMDPYLEQELQPEPEVEEVQSHGRMQGAIHAVQAG